MIELTVALVVILAITAGMLQIASLGRARTETMVRARREAGAAALAHLVPLSAPRYILDWSPGPDGKRLTADDRPIADTSERFDRRIMDFAADDDDAWGVLDRASRASLPDLRGHPNPVAAFGLVRGYDRQTVPLRSAVQHLLYRATDIEIESEVWLTHTRNIY